MANEFTPEPADGGDIGVWGPLELAQNRIALGAKTIKLYNDSGALKMTVGKIGLDNDSKKGTVDYDSIVTISLAAISTSNWAKVELSVSGTTPTIAAVDMSGATDSKVIPAAFRDAYNPAKGGYYIESTKRCIGIIYLDSGDALDNIINVFSVDEGFSGSNSNVLNRNNEYFGICPVGTVLSWHKSFTNTPELPENWVECNGQVLSDSESVYDGQTIPDINGDGRFIRGSATSGTEQDHAFQGHGHDVFSEGSGGSARIQIQAASGDNVPSGDLLGGAMDIIEDAHGVPNVATETRPINISMVWIIRIK